MTRQFLNNLHKRFPLREPFSAGSHLLGAFAGLVGLIYLLCCSNGSTASILAIIIYSFSLITLFLISGLFHGLHCSSEHICRLERLDYAAIYIFIAGTYTPVCLFVISGSLGLGILIAQWTLAFLGVWLAIKRGPSGRMLQVAIFLMMGWAFVFALPSLYSGLSALAFNLLILGGVFYTVGALIFLSEPSLKVTRKLFKEGVGEIEVIQSRIRFLGEKFSVHDLWHLLVLCGSASHYAFIVQVIS